MTNHPNRNWRARMRAAADQWLTTSEAQSLVVIPFRLDERIEAMTKRLRHAYEAGYKARKRDER